MNQTVLITGTSSGIGKSAVQYFSEKGWNVAATMRSPEKETELGKLPNVRLYKLDVTDNQSIKSAIDATIRDFGKIDVLVNNAGYGVDGIFEAMSDETILRQYDTNVFGLMRVTRAIIPVFRAQGGGTIVQIASMGGRITFPMYSIYHGTKWAVEGFSESLAYELRQFNIKVRLVEPGVIKTAFQSSSREFVKPDFTDDYDAFFAQCEKVAQESDRTGTPPEKVAATIYRAATDESWKMRYPVGYPAPLMLWLRNRIPNSWFSAMVRSLYKI